MAVTYRPITVADYEEIRLFLASVGWERRVADRERFHRMLEGTDRAVVALDGTRVVGFARALCDEASNGYISMVAVAQDRRREGIGRELVSQLTAGDPEGHITWVLRAGRGSQAFWERVGFGRSALAMERVRRS
jgi:GNAT superfamily N-acetyltransferase